MRHEQEKLVKIPILKSKYRPRPKKPARRYFVQTTGYIEEAELRRYAPTGALTAVYIVEGLVTRTRRKKGQAYEYVAKGYRLVVQTSSSTALLALTNFRSEIRIWMSLDTLRSYLEETLFLQNETVTLVLNQAAPLDPKNPQPPQVMPNWIS